MGKVRVGMRMSLDGFVSDRDGDVSRLYPDMEAMRATAELQEAVRATGAVVMGRRAYDMANGDFTGYEFQTPIFVLTHRAPDEPAKGQNERLTIAFVPVGIERAISLAKTAAGDRDVTVVGGVSTVRQCLAAGLVDELHIDLRAVLLRDGLRLFDPTDAAPMELEPIRVTESPGVTHLRFRVPR